MNRERLRQIARKSRLLRNLYRHLKKQKPGLVPFFNPGIPEITPVMPRASRLTGWRLNLLVPSISQEHVFGGISTALKFFATLADSLPGNRRLILTDAAPGQTDRQSYAQYEFVRPEDEDREGWTILPYNDRYNRSLPIAAGDIFIATSWWSAYLAQGLIRWQQAEYGAAKNLVYLIQDFEPGFYPWSGHYSLADATYRSGQATIAVFNATFLKDYFHNNGYQFANQYCFEPRLNSRLHAWLNSKQIPAKSKQILVYGRPSVSRNAFELIVEALRIWVWQQNDCREWTVLSAGESHPPVDLGNQMRLVSVGKLTLDAYAETLAHSAIGLSLMISPHPSYPPMEMAVFGLGVITNQFANKDLSTWHDQIVSLPVCTPTAIAVALCRLCSRFAADRQAFAHGRLLQPDYLSADGQFAWVPDLLRDLQLEPGD